MRYAIGILVASAALAMCVVGYADTIAWRQGGGTYAGVDWTDVKCDDAAMRVRSPLTVPSGNGYAYVRARFGSTYESTIVIGWAEMFTLVTPTSTGNDIVIDNATITFRGVQVHEGVESIMLYRMTTPWLNGTPGEIDRDVCFSYKQASTTTTWSGGDFSTADYTETNAAVIPWPDGNSGTVYPVDATTLMQDLYDSGTNAGFFMMQPNVLNENPAKPGLSEAGSVEWIYYVNMQPTLEMTYHYAAGPIPGDADGDGKIDGADLATWQQNYDPLGLNANTWEMGDWNTDLNIDGADLALWQQNYDPLGPPTGVGAVPEPGTMLLLGTGLLGALGYVRRRRMN